jgi:Tfp pilus assembly protein PilX
MRMRTRLIEDRGNALVVALLVMGIMLAFGLAVISLTEGNQGDSRRERETESSFQLAEGVLNAQIYQLSTRWPDALTAVRPPASCTAASTEQDCPSGSLLQANYTGVDYNQPTQWTTQVRDNGGATPNLWSDSLLSQNPPVTWDANGDNFLWVYATATVNGRRRTLVALVEAETVGLSFPHATLVAGHFEVSNNGNKVLIDTNGESNEWPDAGDIIVRCNIANPGCADWDQGKGQVEPATIKSNPSQPPAVSPEALDQLRVLARTQGNYYTGCAPSLAGDQPGEIVFMENATGCRWNANAVYNTVNQPGYVVIATGDNIVINGTATFYGVIYHANTDNRAGYLINLAGNVSIYGSIVIDGDGGLSAGSSKVNLVYDPRVFGGFKAFGTAGIVQNTFREISR